MTEKMMKTDDYLEWLITKLPEICQKFAWRECEHFFSVQAWHDENGLHHWRCAYMWHEQYEGDICVDDLEARHNNLLEALHILKEQTERFLGE